MTENLKQIIKDELINLPKESQTVITNFDWENTTKEIGKTNLLDENEINQLQAEVALVLLGIADEDILSLNIEDRVGTSKKEALKITGEITQKILKPILDKIRLLKRENNNVSNPSWVQSINFIISGGDYSFVEDKRENNNSSINKSI